jgi:hypothetical protein
LDLPQRHDVVMQFGGSKLEISEVSNLRGLVQRIGCHELHDSHFNGSTGFVSIGTRRNGNEGLIVNRAIHIDSSANSHFSPPPVRARYGALGVSLAGTIS